MRVAAYLTKYTASYSRKNQAMEWRFGGGGGSNLERGKILLYSPQRPGRLWVPPRWVLEINWPGRDFDK